ncbi:MAG: CocE/NonD family hydrolase, partial [Acidobacteria bacterium]|nr:CocE/NonD family hydrolase [Acidobacteriota bacterium]
IAQPWSTGKVGSTGVSYVGTASEMLLANQHPAVKAIAPRFSLLDGYDDIAFPGGVHLSWFTENWGSYNDALDRNVLTERLQGFQKKTVKGVAPVDGHEDLLEQAVAEHKNNYDVSTFAKSITYRDDAAASGLTLARMSPFAKPAIAQSQTPIYSYSGWYDGAYQRAAAARFMSYGIPGSRLIIGAWDHGGRQNISPHDPPGTPVTRERPSPAGFQAGPPRTPVFDQTGELMRFFDLHLKGKDDGFGQEKPVRYYTMGEEAWKEADSWPPPAQSYTLHFAQNRALTETAPAADAAPDEYTVDLTSSTGAGSRWRSYFNTTGAKIGYPDRAEADKKLLVYNSAPLAADMEITGHPAITLWVASSASDGQFFAYLEDVAPDGTVNYITEGLIRALHRAQNPAPYWHPVPSHSYLKEHGRPLTPGEPAEISFALLPTSYLVRKGHSLRVALAGADSDQFAPLAGDAPIWRVYRDAAHPSRLELPIVSGSAADSTSAAAAQ